MAATGGRTGKFLLGALTFCLLSLFLLLAPSPPAHAVTFTSQLVTNFPAAGGLPADSNPSVGAAMGGYFYFAASDGTNGTTGRELWRTDGTPGGTALVKDICPGAGDSSPQMIVAASTSLFFVATDGLHGQQLWKSDGTPAGTVPISSLPTNAAITDLFATGNGACYGVNYGGAFSLTNILLRTDGTVAGTFPLTGPGGVVTTNYVFGNLDVSGTDIVFGSLDYYDGLFLTNSLWSFSGTGPYVAFKLTTQPSQITDAHIVGTNCYFVAGGTNYNTYAGTTSTNGVHWCYITNYYARRYMWRVNLYGQNLQVADASPWGGNQGYSGPYCIQNGIGFYDSQFYGITVANGHLFYTYNWTPFGAGANYTYGPWMALGQSGSPVTIDPNNGAHVEVFIGSIGANTYFHDPYTNSVIYRTDGVSSPVLALDLGALGFHPTSYQQVGTKFYFQDGGSLGSYTGLGVTDLTQGGTHRITSGGTLEPTFYYPGFLGALGSLALYHIPDPQTGDEPYRSDGTTNGTFLLKDIALGTNSPPPSTGIASGGLFYFPLGTPDTGLELWRSDGTAAGTFLLKDINPGTNGSSPSQLTPCNGLLFFSANDGSHGQELWRSDGTLAGTYMVKDIRLGAAGSNPTNLVVTGSQLFFVGDDGSHGPELWVSDGTATGTFLVQDIQPGIASANIHGLGASGGEAHFMAGTNSTAGQLWFSTAAPGGAQFLYDFGQLQYTSLPQGFTPFNGKFFFGLYFYSYTDHAFEPYLVATDDTPSGTGFIVANAGNEIGTAGGRLFTTSYNALLTSDGTATGTVVLVTNLPGVGQLTPLGTQMYFAAGAGLWSSDGTTNGTFPVAQFSDPSQAVANLTPFQGALIFSAGSPALGRELWATAPGQGATVIEDLSPQSGSDNLQVISAATNQVFYVAKPAGQSAWQLRTLHLQSLTNPSGPYGGTPWPVPGLIEAENYDLGGDGVGYHDLTADNEGGAYRLAEGVDIEPCNDTNGGFCVFNTRPGEWIDYTVNAAYTGIYQIEIRMTSAAENIGLYHFEVDGVLVDNEGVYNNGTPGGWVSIIDAIPFFAGVHVLRVVFDQPTLAGDVGVFNYFNFTALETNQPPVVFISSPPAGGIISTDQPVVLAAQVIDPTTWFQPTVQFFVDGQSLGTVSNAPYNLSWTPTPGPHTVSAVATDSFGASGASSNLLFFVAEPLLPEGSLWRANPFGTNLPNSWHSTGYDDSHWPRVRASFGFGYPDIRTLTPSNFNGSPIPTFYFRTTFTNALSNFNFASLTLTRDDAAVVWINGQLLARINLPQPPTNVVFTNLALTNVINNTTRTNPAVDVLPVPTSMLLDGTNLIAVEIHQGRPDPRENFDMKFDLSFSTFLYTPAPVLNIFGASSTNNGGVTVQWPDSFTNWTLEHSFNLTTWNAVNGTLIDTNGFLNLILAPPLNARDFFRLYNTNGP